MMRAQRLLQPTELPFTSREHVIGQIRRRGPHPPARAAHWDTVEVLQLASSLTALSSLLTALWMRRRDDPHLADQAGQQEPEPEPCCQAPPPASAAEVWAAAWAAFAAQQQQQQQQPDGGRPMGGITPEADAMAQPLLWIQGIKPKPRSELLALALAALQTEVTELPNDVETMLDSEQWLRICPAVLASCSTAAAAAWLGYVPHSLQSAAVAHPSTGKLAVAVGAVAADGDGKGGAGEDYKRALWYGLEERLPLYCSILRLLKASSIRPEQAGCDDGSNRASDDFAEPGQAAALDPPADALLAWRGADALQRAQRMLARCREGSAPGMLRGWRATQAGARSASQLLDIAPSVLHDMAVLIADAVAAAYLTEVTAGGVTAANLPDTAGAPPTARGAAVACPMPAELAASPSGPPSASPGAAQPMATRQAALLESSLWPTFVHHRLGSTRQLQRFANRLALARWADRCFHSVAAMYEDRLPLFTLAASLRAPAQGGAAPGPRLRVRRVPLKRARELAHLRGLRFAVSLFLEAADVAAPALRALWERAAGGVTWLLVHAVGRAVGLVWQGIRQGAGNRGQAAARQRQGRSGGGSDEMGRGGSGVGVTTAA